MTTHASGRQDWYPASALSHLQVMALKSNDAFLSSVSESHQRLCNKLNSNNATQDTYVKMVFDNKTRIICQANQGANTQNAATLHMFPSR